jgi:hypothetical protein
MPERAKTVACVTGSHGPERCRRWTTFVRKRQKSFRAKLAKLNAPILIVQGDVGEGPMNTDGPGRNRCERAQSDELSN